MDDDRPVAEQVREALDWFSGDTLGEAPCVLDVTHGLTLATAYRALRAEHERLTDHIHQLQLDADKRILAGRALAAEAAEARHQYHQHLSEADMVASNLEDRCREAEADVARLTALLHRTVMLLDASSCYSCGAEPGCNIDCGLCHLTAELQREGLAPKEDK